MGGSTASRCCKTAKALHPPTAVILMTAFGSVSTAVEAMKSGAFDYVQKPFEIEEMEVKIDKALEVRRMQHQIDYLRHAQGDIYDFDSIIGASGALENVLDVVAQGRQEQHHRADARRDRHRQGAHRRRDPPQLARAARNFIKVNCAALPENLLESELFGHEKGAFTGADKQRIGRFEQADGGTLFLDEIGDMSANTQAKLLRVLQEHEFERSAARGRSQVDVRLIAATNRDLTTMVDAGDVPRGPLLPPQRGHHRDAAAARAQGGHPARSPHFFIQRFAGELKKKIDGLDARRAEAADALQLAGQHPRARERDRARDAARRRRLIAVDDLRLGETAAPACRARRASIVQDSADRHPARGDRTAGDHRGAEDVELGAEGRRGAARHQPARDELQDQDARHRLPARPARAAQNSHATADPYARVGHI